jgi:hypothetical protein
MKYRVRTRDGGELDYLSFGQVEQAWLLGLIDPDDEVVEEGRTRGRRAGDIPLLVSARRSSEQVWRGTWFLWTLIGIFGATVGLSLIGQKELELKVAGIVVVFGVTSLMIRVSAKAWERRKPH